MNDARIEALRAALAIRKSGDTPATTIATAQEFLDWIQPPAQPPAEPIQKSGQPPRR
jgi:hypothetical protein